MQAGRQHVERQELPQEPLRAARPERQRRQVLPVGADARIGGGDEIGRVVRHRHQEHDHQDERQPDPEEPVGKERDASLARQARRHEQARKKEHQRHQADILPGAKQVEREPPMAVDDGDGLPEVGRIIEAVRARRQRRQIGKDGMERQDNDDHNRTQVAQGNAGSGHVRCGPRAGRPGGRGIPLFDQPLNQNSASAGSARAPL